MAEWRDAPDVEMLAKQLIELFDEVEGGAQ